MVPPLIWMLGCVWHLVANHWERLDLAMPDSVTRTWKLRPGVLVVFGLVACAAAFAASGRFNGVRKLNLGIMPITGIPLFFLSYGGSSLWTALIGVGLCGANRLRGQAKITDLAEGLGMLAQTTFEMLLNTVSFARVGAFALAHAALQSTVIILADSIPIAPLALLAVVLGNLIVVILETVVVSIQATRLVLFEFFIRFFAGEGRALKPATPPRAP